MAYTNPWDVTTPPGTEQAKKIDDHFRRLRLDLQERLLSLFVSMTADPVVLKDELTGKKTGKILTIPFAAFAPDENATGFVMDAGTITFGSAAGPVRAPVTLPQGVTIKKVRWLVSSTDSAAITLQFKSAAFDAGAAIVVENSMTKSASGIEIKDSGTITIGVDGTRYWWLEADKTSGSEFTIYAVQITYDAPDARSTL